MNTPTRTIEEICHARRDLAAYIDGELTAGEELRLEIHLANCAACRTELNEQKKLLRALDTAFETIEPEIELPADFTRVVVANAESRVSGLRRPHERRQAFFVCAALFVFVLLGLGGETRQVFNTFARFAEQFIAVAGFVWNLIYDVAFGAAIILRSLSHQIILDSTAAFAVLSVFVFVALVAFTRFAVRLDRS